MRLFCVASCRVYWDDLADGRSQKAVIKLEEAADGKITEVELSSAEYEAKNVRHLCVFGLAACAAAIGTPSNVIEYLLRQNTTKGRSKLGKLFQEVYGNPFEPVTLNHSWLTTTVQALANGIYEEKAFDRMPILADALHDAGCDNEDILNHCRQPGEHVRGCWVVDLLLAKG